MVRNKRIHSDNKGDAAVPGIASKRITTLSVPEERIKTEQDLRSEGLSLFVGCFLSLIAITTILYDIQFWGTQGTKSAERMLNDSQKIRKTIVEAINGAKVLIEQRLGQSEKTTTGAS